MSTGRLVSTPITGHPPLMGSATVEPEFLVRTVTVEMTRMADFGACSVAS